MFNMRNHSFIRCCIPVTGPGARNIVVIEVDIALVFSELII